MKKALLITLAVSLLSAVQALASGSSGVPGPTGVREPLPKDPLTVTETMKCIVTHIREDGTILVRDREGDPEHPLLITKKTKITAQDKKAFDGRKKLDVADIRVGQKLRVTHRAASGESVRIRILKES